MRVLLVDDDIFAGVGGGQTFLRKLVHDHPDIEFTYFRRREPADAARPANARAVPVGSERSRTVLQPVFTSPADISALQTALAYVEAIAGETFDVVDVPDYKLFGPYLRDALKAFAVTTRAIVHAMHGVLSDSISRDWATLDRDVRDLRALEMQQFLDADGRYAISAAYVEEWRSRTGIAADLLDPTCVLDRHDTIEPTAPGSTPELLCVGRREGRKGNDLAIDIVAWLNSDLHRGLRHIGPPSPAGPNVSSDDILADVARARDIAWRVEGPYSVSELMTLYRADTALLTPVRYDTFNLAVLEAASVGVPVSVSDRAGVSRYLAELGSPALIIDPDRPESTAAAMNTWLEDYADLRRRSIESAKRIQERIRALDIRGCYARAIERRGTGVSSNSGITFATETAARKVVGRDTIKQAIHSARTFAYQHRHSPWIRTPYNLVRPHLRRNTQVAPASVQDLARKLNTMPEGSLADIDHKIDLAGRFDWRASGRCTVWSEMARLERLRGGDMRAAAYDIRTMRLSGRDHFGRLPLVQETLRASGMSEVARAISSQHTPSAETDKISDLLAERRKRLLAPHPLSRDVAAEVVENRNGDTSADISVIVSIYNAGPKLDRFLAQLSQQTAVLAGRVELVLVDAASLLDEASAVQRAAAAEPFKNRIVYIRTSDRISIQGAWNVALQHTRGKFITCLGVDEALYPAALARLAATLEAQPGVDWAMASSVVTDVSVDGALKRDKMFYDRSNAARDMTMLDTTYLSWVGGLYRRSIHDRFGYYDADFRAAGDTEFKNRILPFLSVVYVPTTFGVFLDYPDDRASASVRAELEDALAWYLFRTPEGAAPLLAQRSTTEVAAIALWCAGRRKCYRTEPSSDVEFGVVTATALAARPDAPPFAPSLVRTMVELRDELRRYDLVETRDQRETSAEALIAYARKRGSALKEAFGMDAVFDGFNDNRFEQHSWVWSKTS